MEYAGRNLERVVVRGNAKLVDRGAVKREVSVIYYNLSDMFKGKVVLDFNKIKTYYMLNFILHNGVIVKNRYG